MFLSDKADITNIISKMNQIMMSNNRVIIQRKLIEMRPNKVILLSIKADTINILSSVIAIVVTVHKTATNMQAMVHLSGENSKYMLMVTRLVEITKKFKASTTKSRKILFTGVYLCSLKLFCHLLIWLHLATS